MRKSGTALGLAAALFGGFCMAYALIDFAPGQVVYVKAATENLRATPNGEKVGTVDKGTEMTVIEDRGNWVKVRLQAWIWKPSLTDSRLALQGDVYRALQIIVGDRAKAEELLVQIKGGVDFQALARQHSIGPAAQKGGDLGYFKKGDFQPEFEAVILNLKPGQVSGVIESPAGFHLFKRVE